MTIFELIRSEITAKQAAEHYGLRFDRSGRGYCPWHDDGAHPALQFFDDGGCYCHSCHAHGDATDIAAKMLGLSPKDAAWRLYRDFHLRQPVESRQAPEAQARKQAQREEHERLSARYSYLCDVVHEAEKRLEKYTPETVDAEFDLILSAKVRAETELNLLWEALKRERA